MLFKTIIASTFFISSLAFSNSIVKTTVETGGFLNKTKADLYYPDNIASTEINSAIVFNPGALIPASEMELLASTFAENNSVVYVIHNALNFPVLPNNQKKPLKLLEALKRNPSKLSNMPAGVVNLHRDGVKTILMGHSMGGAVLNQSAKDLTSDLLDGVVYLGASKVVGEPRKPEVPVAFVYGELDGLVDEQLISELSEKLDAQIFKLKDVNHFCFIPNETVGSEEYRNRDQESPMNSEGCNMELWETLKDADWI